MKIILEGIEYRSHDKLYAVSRNGIVLRLKTLSIAAVYRRKDGYICLPRGGVLHRLVAMCWLERPDGTTDVHHINEDKSDNRVENLEWVSRKQHAERHEWGRHVVSESAKQKLREYRTGRKHTDKAKRKIRKAIRRLGIKPPPRPIGFKCSDEAKAKMSLNSPNAHACRISGVVYRSFRDASRALGIKPHTLRKRCLSSSFGDHELV